MAALKSLLARFIFVGLILDITSLASSSPTESISIFDPANSDERAAESARSKGPSCGYSSCPKTETDKINVHIIAHTHDDVGWLKTVDQYYYGTRMGDAAVGVQHILDSVIPQLVMDPSKRFIYVEMSFFTKWWHEQEERVKAIVKRLVDEGRLEFINGGWCMNDEATVNYQSTIEQMTLGLKFLNETFGPCAHPKVGWQIDPFGHTNEQASLFAQFGFDGMFFTRISYEDKQQRKQNKSLDLIWHGDRVLAGQDGSIFTNVFKDTYDSPQGYCFDVLCQEDNLVENKNSYEYNIEGRGDKYIDYLREYSKTKIHNHILIPMGGDFHFSAAGQNFKNIDKLIRYVREKAPEFNIFYSTPSCYQYSVYQHLRANDTLNLPEKYDDFMPYDSTSTVWWSGYFVSRPSVKLIERETANLLQVARDVSLANLLRLAAPTSPSKDSNLTWVDHVKLHERNCLMPLWEILGDLQHHDAVTGTEKQHVSDDYVRRVSDASSKCAKFIGDFRREKLSRYVREQLTSSPSFLVSPSKSIYSDLDPIYLEDTMFCHTLNISQCAALDSNVDVNRYRRINITQTKLNDSPLIKPTFISRSLKASETPLELATKAVLVNVYNPLAKQVEQHDIRLPCLGRCDLDKIKVIHLSSSEAMPLIRLPVPAGIMQLPHRDATTTYEILFYANLPPLGYTSFVLEDSNSIDLIDEEISPAPVATRSTDDRRKRSSGVDEKSLINDDDLISVKAEDVGLKADADGLCDLIELDLSFNQNKAARVARSESSLSQQSAADRVLVKFDLNTGMIVSLRRMSDGNLLPITQRFGYYFPANSQAQPGAYIFRPNSSEPYLFEKPMFYKMYKRRQETYIEIHQKWADWLWQTIRVDSKKNYIEFDYVVGPIPLVPGDRNSNRQIRLVGREVVTRYSSNLVNNGIFLTDSNDRQLLTRHRRRTNVSEDLGGSFYPVVSTLLMRNTNSNLTSGANARCERCSAEAIAILVDRAQAGTSLNEGQLELLIHRRHTRDDNFGVGEPLDEPGEDGRGLVVRGKHRMYIKFQELPESLSGRKKLRPQVFKLPPNPRANVEFERQFYLNEMEKLSGKSSNSSASEQNHSTYIVKETFINDLNQEAKRISMKPLLTFDRLRVSSQQLIGAYKYSGYGTEIRTDLTLLNNSLPNTVHLLTLQPWSTDKNSLLIRLENLENPITVHPFPDFKSYQILAQFYKTLGDNYALSLSDWCKNKLRERVEFDVQYLIKKIRILELEELNLGANARLKDDKRLDWTDEFYDRSECESSDSPTKVKLSPRQIRTFLAKFEFL